MSGIARRITGASRHGRDEHDFHRSGPKHLSTIDWENEEHQRMVAACLVKGAYVKRLDLKDKVDGTEAALAPPWWENVRFTLLKNIHYHWSSSIGVVYEFNSSRSSSLGDISPWKAPRLVFAFRGTQNLLDGIHDAVLSLQRLEGSSKICRASEETIKIVLGRPREANHGGGGDCKIWMAGHSLGASIATFVAMRLIEREGTYAETFLFNPPYLRLDPVTIQHKRVSLIVKKLQKKTAKIFAGAMREAGEGSTHPRLEGWTPKLFVNPSDLICSGFLGYFENMGHFRGMSPGNLMRVEVDGRLCDLDRPFIGVDSLPIYLLPSGKLTTNETPIEVEERSSFESVIRGEHVKKMLQAHRLSQWWREDQELRHRHYHRSQLNVSNF